MCEMSPIARKMTTGAICMGCATGTAMLITLFVISILTIKSKIPTSASGYVIAGLTGGLGVLGIGISLLSVPKLIKRDHILSTISSFLMVGALVLAVTVAFVVMGMLASQGKMSSVIVSKATLGVYGGLIGLSLIGAGCVGSCVVGVSLVMVGGGAYQFIKHQ